VNVAVGVMALVLLQPAQVDARHMSISHPLRRYPNMTRHILPIASVCRTLLCVAGVSLATAGVAGPADYVFVPYADAGVRRLAYDFGTEQGRDGGRESEHAVSLGWTPMSRWFTAVYAGWYAEPGESLRFYSWSWLNHVQLTTPGAGPVGAGLLCEIERPRERADGTGITFGPTLQFDTGHLQINVNPLLEKYVGAQAPAAAALKYQWQVKGLWRQGIELGAQGFGQVGPWNHWLPASQQEHSLGPAAFAKWTLGEGRVLNLDAAWLVGVGAGSPKNTVRMRLQHEF
jgi:hypothetical protein